MKTAIECTLTTRIERAPGIESFRFSPARPLSFLPGQYVQVCFDPEEPANRELNKPLSLSCAPGLDYIEVTKKISTSAFTERFRGLRPGDVVALRGPFGNCVLADDDRRAAFLAGGVGIAPIFSMVEHAGLRRRDLEMRLFYSNRHEAEFAFKAELEAQAVANPRLAVRLFLTGGTPQDPRLETGRITADRLRTDLDDPRSWVCFIFGPPPMVEAMRTACLEIGIPGAQVRSESFSGY